MNIFVLDRDPKIAAQMMCDKHVVKMVLEAAQMLSTIQHKNGMEPPYKPTHANHPCTRWAGTSTQNYSWLWHHGMSLCEEYTHRYGKTHKCQQLITGPLATVPPLPSDVMTPFAQAMPEQHKRPDAVEAYRQYYIHEKARFAKWKNREVPEWFKNAVTNEEEKHV